MRSALLLVALAPLSLLACAGVAPCPAAPATGSATAAGSATASATAPASATATDADFVLVLRPSPTPTPLVHVEETAARADALPGPWRITLGTPDHVTHAVAHDRGGDIPVDLAATPDGGVELRLGRAAAGTVTVAYDVLAGDDAPDDALGLLVLDDRFRGAGEKLVALPAAAEDARATVLVRVDGEALRTPGAASSLGVGSARRTTLPPRALRHASFLAGSLGAQVIDDPAAGHDEGSWLGYTAFDPRPTVAELALVRTSLRELLKSYAETPWTYLFVSQTRPIGSFTTTPRALSVLVQVGPAEPWSAGLRLSVTQQLARLWIGAELHVTGEAGHEAEGAWFAEGVSRYVATLVLSRLGLLPPDEVKNAVAGELSVLATSPHKALGNARLAELAQKDDVARATLMARGALYALRESVAIRARSKGERGLEAVLVGLVKKAEDAKQGAMTTAAWLDAVGKEDPDAAKTFDALVVRGEPVELPASALGPCFRAGRGEYVAWDPGFDVEATRMSKEGKVVGVRSGGPADRAGVKEGDVVESMHAREGDADVQVKMVVVRAGAKVTVAYLPRGARGKGQTWTRVMGRLEDGKCGELP
ncbi:MAG TPA: hypothetical protein VIF15_02715 [Polyangiaceae bacterium]